MKKNNKQIESLIELFEGLTDDSIKFLNFLARKNFTDMEYDVAFENGKLKAYHLIIDMLRELLK